MDLLQPQVLQRLLIQVVVEVVAGITLATMVVELVVLA
jgi:hypothetical protein